MHADILKLPLTDEHYQLLLQQWDGHDLRTQPESQTSLPMQFHSEEPLLPLFPEHLVHAERQRRKDKRDKEKREKAEKKQEEQDASLVKVTGQLPELRKLKNIHRNKRGYGNLTQAIDVLIQSGKLSQAFELTNKLVKSGYRDGYLSEIMLAAIKARQPEIVKKCSSLFRDKDQQKIIKAFSKAYKNNKIAAACRLLGSTNSSDYALLIERCVAEELDANTLTKQHIQQLIDAGFFCLYMDDVVRYIGGKFEIDLDELNDSKNEVPPREYDSDEQEYFENIAPIKLRVVKCMLALYLTKSGFLKKIKALKEKNPANFGEAVLTVLLDVDLELAMRFTNIWLDEKDQWYTRRNEESLKKILKRKFKKLSPTVEHYRIIGLLEHEGFYSTLVYAMDHNEDSEYGDPADISEKLSVLHIDHEDYLCMRILEREHLLLFNAIPCEYIRTKRLFSYLMATFRGQGFAEAKRCCELMESEMQGYWLKTVAYIEQADFDGLIHYLIDRARQQSQASANSSMDNHVHEEQYRELMHYAASQWIPQHDMTQLYEKLLMLLQQWHVINEPRVQHNRECERTDNNEKYQLESIVSKVYRYIVAALYQVWSKLLEERQQDELLVDGISRMLAYLMPEICNWYTGLHITSTLKTIMKRLQEKHQYSYLLNAAKLHIQLSNEFSPYDYEPICDSFIADEQIDLLVDFIRYVAETQKQAYWVNSMWLKVCTFHFKIGSHAEAMKVIGDNEELLSNNCRAPIKEWVQQLLQAAQGHLVIVILSKQKNYFGEENYVEMVEAAIKAIEFVTAKQILKQYVTTPGTVVRLEKAIQQAYLTRLDTLITKERRRVLEVVFNKYTRYKQLLSSEHVNEQKKKQAQELQNEMILSLRQILDKSFLFFYEKKFGPQPVIKGKPLGIYFPVVPDLQGKSIDIKLNIYYNKFLKIPQFVAQYPELTDFIKFIQPQVNPDYLWLDQLYKLANLEKHDKVYVPLKPTVDGNAIDMIDFLFKALNGVTQILIKLFNNQFTMDQLNELVFLDYVMHATNDVSQYTQTLALTGLSQPQVHHADPHYMQIQVSP